MKSPSQELLYLEMWKSEEKQNEKAKTKSFEYSQTDKEVLKQQESKDTEHQATEQTEDFLGNPSHKKLYVKCMCDNRKRK